MARAAQTPVAIRHALRFIREQTEHLRELHAMNFGTVANHFLRGFTEGSDESLRALWHHFLDLDEADPVPWVEETQEAGEPAPLPDDRAARVGLPLRLLKAIQTQDKVDFRYLLAMGFPGPNMHEKTVAFHEELLGPWIEELEDFCDDLEDELPEDDETLVDVTEIADEVLAEE